MALIEGTRAVAAAAVEGDVAVVFGPHCPIPRTNADAEIAGEEVGYNGFDLNASAPISTLIVECSFRAKEMVIATTEIGPRQVSYVGADTPAFKQQASALRPMRGASQLVS